MNLSTATTLLFVPGDRPERFAKAAAAGADLVVVDLEDAVPAEHKELARGHVVTWLSEGGAGAVRINASDTGEHAADVAALAGLGCVVLVPKAEDPDALREIAGLLGPGTPLLALVETAAGVLRAPEIAAVDAVQRLAFGSFDLAAQLGVSPDDRLALQSARSALVLASAAAGLPAPVARAALRPSADDVAWARTVVAAAGEGGVALVEGRMVDKPVVDRARRILDAAG